MQLDVAKLHNSEEVSIKNIPSLLCKEVLAFSHSSFFPSFCLEYQIRMMGQGRKQVCNPPCGLKVKNHKLMMTEKKKIPGRLATYLSTSSGLLTSESLMRKINSMCLTYCFPSFHLYMKLSPFLPVFLFFLNVANICLKQLSFSGEVYNYLSPVSITLSYTYNQVN